MPFKAHGEKILKSKLKKSQNMNDREIKETFDYLRDVFLIKFVPKPNEKIIREKRPRPQTLEKGHDGPIIKKSRFEISSDSE